MELHLPSSFFQRYRWDEKKPLQYTTTAVCEQVLRVQTCRTFLEIIILVHRPRRFDGKTHGRFFVGTLNPPTVEFVRNKRVQHYGRPRDHEHTTNDYNPFDGKQKYIYIICVFVMIICLFFIYFFFVSYLAKRIGIRFDVYSVVLT